MKKKIIKVAIKITSDDDPLLYDEIGCFSREATSSVAVNHWRRGGDVKREHEWFNPANSGSKENAERDYLLMMDLCANNRSFIHVRAVAKIEEDGDEADDIEAAGVGGILDDDEVTIGEVKKESLKELGDQLKLKGFSEEEIREAVESAEVEYD